MVVEAAKSLLGSVSHPVTGVLAVKPFRVKVIGTVELP